jgi:dTDP-4-dehydrorhamnose reductase
VQSVIVLGGSGLVGSRIRALWADSLELQAPTHAALDVLDHAALADYVAQTRAAVVVNAVAWADVDGAEAQRGDELGLAFQLNVSFAGRLAALCQRHNKYLVHLSTDYVFDGTNDQRPYREDDPVQPLCWYAQTKAWGEEHVRAEGVAACIARIEMPFSAQPHHKLDFARTCVARFETGQGLVGVVDQHITPVYLDDGVAALRRLVEQRVTGTVHLASTTWTTPYDFARAIATRTGFAPDLVQPDSFDHFVAQRPARRPRHSWLDVTYAEQLLGQGVLRQVDEQLDAWAAQLLVVPGHPRRVR